MENRVDFAGTTDLAEGPDWTPYLYISWSDEYVEVSTEHQSQNGTPFEVWHGRATMIKLPQDIDALWLTDFVADDLLPQFEQILKGYTEDYDNQSNLVGNLTEDAEAHLDDIRNELTDLSYNSGGQALHGGQWDAADWFLNAISIEEFIDQYGIRLEMTRQEIKTVVDRIQEEAAYERTVIYGIESLIEDAQEAIAEAADDQF